MVSIFDQQASKLFHTFFGLLSAVGESGCQMLATL